MPTLEEIKAQIEALPHKYIFYTKKEINYLPEIMVEGEVIRALVSGYAGKKTVLLACTNRRILMLDKGFFFGLRQWQIALDRVQSIDGEYLIAFGSIKIWDGAAATQLNMVMASNIDPFIKEVRQAIDDFKRLSFAEASSSVQQYKQHAQQHYEQYYAEQAQSATQEGQANDIASQLERLAQLKESGHLTQEEFDSQKAKLLAAG